MTGTLTLLNLMCRNQKQKSLPGKNLPKTMMMILKLMMILKILALMICVAAAVVDLMMMMIFKINTKSTGCCIGFNTNK